MSRGAGKIAGALGLVVLFGLAGALTTGARNLAGQHPATQAGEKRTIYCKSARSLGALYLGQTNSDCALDTGRQIGPTQGDQTFFVPAGMKVIYEPNAVALAQPQLMNGISPQSIDILWVQAVEMDENETGKCDRLIGAAALHFKKLQALIIDNSDVSDEGLAHLKNMPDLAVISALSCQAINGKCFSTLSQLPNLQRLSMRGNVINAQDLKYLALCPRLTYLNLRGKTINPDGLKTIANSATVKELVVSDNRKIDDKALAFLLPFRTLCSLDLSGTAVTDAGMKYLTKLPGLQTLKLERTAITLKGLIVLKPLKLKELSVSSALFKPIEVEKSGKLAAHITFTDDSNQVPEDLKTDFAPLH